MANLQLGLAKTNFIFVNWLFQFHVYILSESQSNYCSNLKENRTAENKTKLLLFYNFIIFNCKTTI